MCRSTWLMGVAVLLAGPACGECDSLAGLRAGRTPYGALVLPQQPTVYTPAYAPMYDGLYAPAYAPPLTRTYVPAYARTYRIVVQDGDRLTERVVVITAGETRLVR